MKWPTKIVLVMLLGICVIAHSQTGNKSSKSDQKPSSEQIKKWIGDLDSSKFQVRRNATRSLTKAGRKAFTIVTKHAIEGNAEVSHRCTVILVTLSRSADLKTARAAKESLKIVTQSDNTTAAARATEGLKFFTRVGDMREIAGSVQIYRNKNDGDVEAKLVKKMLLRLNGLERGALDGSLWAYGKKGRPAAIAKIYTTNPDSGQWTQTLISISKDKVFSGKIATQQVVWKSDSPGLEFKTISKAPTPAKDKAARLKQLKLLATRFKAHEFWPVDKPQIDLPLRESPVYRYDDEKSGLVDGAMFVFMMGDNPECAMLIEAKKQKNSKVVWQYAFFPTGSAKLHGHLDGKEVWQKFIQPILGNANSPYWIFAMRHGEQLRKKK